MADFRRRMTRTRLARTTLAGAGLLVLAACTDGFDGDFRNAAGGFDTTAATRLPTERRPNPDDRGIISYPNFQVAVARRGDTVRDVANRIGQDPAELGRYNGIAPDEPLRAGEVLALPRRVAEPSPATGAEGFGPIRPDDSIDITTLAGTALDRADAERPATSTPPFQTKPLPPQTGREPIQHKVVRGETAYSISRLYNVSVRSLADWNGLGTDLMVREGQYLIIPVASEAPPRAAAPETAPGQGSPTPAPPSASAPLPKPGAAAPAVPASPNLAAERTTAGGRLLMPVQGNIVRAYEKGRNDGVDIAAQAGTQVRAAEDGFVGALLKDTNGVQILVIRHDDNILTVYANIDGVSVKKGDKVTRGQNVALVKGSGASFVHFEVRIESDSVDPMPYFN